MARYIETFYGVMLLLHDLTKNCFIVRFTNILNE